jgi:hypothetical protein
MHSWDDMAILEEIETYFAKQPNWQQRAFAELRGGRKIDTEFCWELKESCLEGAEGVAKPASKSTLNVANAAIPDPSSVRLLGIEKVERINRLAANQSLKFASDGLTVVYGDNGSGKTGYDRILRHVCQARGGRPELRGSVFEPPNKEGTAEIVFSLSGVEQRAKVTAGATHSCPLSRFSIFDSTAANILVRQQNDTAFRPFGLDLLERFTEVADRVKALIDDELRQTATPFLLPNDYPEITSAGKVIKSLNTEHGRKQVEAGVVPLSEFQETRRQELRVLLQNAKNNDPTKMAQALNAKVGRYQLLCERLTSIATELAPDKLNEFSALRKEMLDAETAAEIARAKAFDSETLKEVGGGVWKQLWDAARTYASVAVPGQSLNAAKEGDRCVLCAQLLTVSAAQRFQTLEEFVAGKVQGQARALRKKFVARLEEVKVLPLKLGTDEALFLELAGDDDATAIAVEAIFAAAQKLCENIQSFATSGEPMIVGQLIPETPSTLKQLSIGFRQQSHGLLQAKALDTQAILQAELFT